MEKIVIHNLRRYKLVFTSDLEVQGDSANNDKSKKTSDKVGNILLQDPNRGWIDVVNPQTAFDIADSNRIKISKSYLELLNPSPRFIESRRKSKENNENNNNRKKKRRK